MIETTRVVTFKGKPVDKLTHAELLRAFFTLYDEHERLKARPRKPKNPFTGTDASLFEAIFG